MLNLANHECYFLFGLFQIKNILSTVDLETLLLFLFDFYKFRYLKRR